MQDQFQFSPAGVMISGILLGGFLMLMVMAIIRLYSRPEDWEVERARLKNRLTWVIAENERMQERIEALECDLDDSLRHETDFITQVAIDEVKNYSKDLNEKSMVGFRCSL